MTNTWRRIPGIFRWLLVSLTIMIIVGLGAYAYRILTIEGEATVLEAIDVDPESFTVELYPGEKVKQSITLNNKSSAELKIDLLISISPSDKGVSAKLKHDSFTVHGGGDKKVDITIKAGNEAEPGVYQISVHIDRNKTDDDDDDD